MRASSDPRTLPSPWNRDLVVRLRNNGTRSIEISTLTLWNVRHGISLGFLPTDSGSTQREIDDPTFGATRRVASGHSIERRVRLGHDFSELPTTLALGPVQVYWDFEILVRPSRRSWELCRAGWPDGVIQFGRDCTAQEFRRNQH